MEVKQSIEEFIHRKHLHMSNAGDDHFDANQKVLNCGCGTRTGMRCASTIYIVDILNHTSFCQN
jgi:hypothetical protein